MKGLSLFICLYLLSIHHGFSQTVTRIRDVSFTGNEILSEDALLEQMNTQPKKGIDKIFFWKKRPEFIRSVFEEDVNRLKNYYHRNGFLNPDINFDLDSSSSGRVLNIAITIRENPFVITGDPEFSLKGDEITEALLDSIVPRLPVKKGQRFRDEDMFATETIVKRAFSDQGYPFTSVRREINLIDSNMVANVAFTVDPGERSYFGTVTVSGDSMISEQFIRKSLHFSQGGLFMQVKIDSTQQDIFNTDLFQYVVIASRKDSVLDGHIPVDIVVKELPRWKLETGIGYGTEDKLRLAADITRLNFLGGSRRLITNLKTSYFLPFSADVRFVQPDFLFQRLDLIINPFYLRERELSYTIDRMGGGIRFIYRFRNNFNSHFSYSFEKDRILELNDLSLNETDLKHNKSVFSLGGEVNTSDDPFYPSKGNKIEGITSLAGLGLAGKVNFYKIQLSYVKYTALSKELVIATKIRGGVLQTLGSDERTPIEERFYLGGASSLRGWGRHRISPLNESGYALGGNTMIEASAELRFPIYEILHGALFFEGGNVWYDPYSVTPGMLRYNTGIGLRVRTPIGPVRLDFATPVINDQFELQFFISVGHAF